MQNFAELLPPFIIEENFVALKFAPARPHPSIVKVQDEARNFRVSYLCGEVLGMVSAKNAKFCTMFHYYGLSRAG